MRVAALEALGLAKTRGPLTTRLEHLTPAVRRAAALGLGHLADPDTLPQVRKAVDDPSPKVREAARWAVQQITGVDAGLQMSTRKRHTFQDP